MNAVCLRDARGDAESILGVVTDITERRRVEQALRESEERLRAIIEQSPISMAIAGMDGTIEYINRRAIETFGYLPEDIPDMDRWWVQAYPDEAYRAEVVATWTGLTLQALREHREIEGREYRVTCKDRTVKTVFILGVPVAEKVFVMFEDVTERKQAEERLAVKQQQLVELNQSLERMVDERTRALQRSYEQLANLSRQVPGLLYQFQMFPDGRVRLPYASEAGRDRFELAHAEDDNDLFDRVHPQDREALIAAMQESARTLQPFHHEFRLLRPVQGTCWCACDSSPQLQEDGSILWHGFITDTTDRKQDEEALRIAKDAAESATRAKSLFLANMSHEIRTPMHAIMGFIELVLDATLTDEHRHYLTLAQARSKDLLVLINDILDLSRIEADRLTLEREPFSPTEAVDEVLQMFAVAANEKGLRLARDTSVGVPAMVLGDWRRLRQVLVNLVGNAVKFTPGGEVAVSLDCAPAEPGDVASLLHFRVRDTGIGMSAEDQALVFEPFAQASEAHHTRYGGAGLGLTIAKRLVAMMGGRIWLESAPAMGSTFHFTVRLDASSISPGAEDSTGAAIGKTNSLNILVVEDEMICRLVAEGQLTWLGHQVTAAENGQEALTLLAREDFDLVLMDLQLPEIDGLEATRIIRDPASTVRNHHIPIIAVTAFAMARDEVRCLEAGMNGYVSKPVSAPALAAAIARAVAH